MRDLLAVDLLLDQAEDALLDVVLVGLGLERLRGALLDEELGEIELLRLTSAGSSGTSEKGRTSSA